MDSWEKEESESKICGDSKYWNLFEFLEIFELYDIHVSNNSLKHNSITCYDILENISWLVNKD